MKIGSWRRSGTDRACVVGWHGGDDAVHDIAILLDDEGFNSLDTVYRRAGEVLDVLRTRSIPSPRERAARVDGWVPGLPLPSTTTAVAVAANYPSHVVETGHARPDPRTQIPKLFPKPRSTFLPSRSRLQLPPSAKDVDWELEVGVVIGSPCRHVSEVEALNHVLGIVPVNDISARRVSWPEVDPRAGTDDSHRFFSWLAGKMFEGFLPVGPYVLTLDEVDDVQDLRIRLTLNGEVMQDGSTSEMMHSVARLVSFTSSLMSLQPGDLIATGTPAGVGAATGRYLTDGDVLEGWIGAAGPLVTQVIGSDER